jgi:hypothetical protein
MKKRIITWALVFIMVLALIPTNIVQANQQPRPLTQTESSLRTRHLTNTQLNRLLTASPSEMQRSINTVADAISFLDLKFPTLWSSLHIWTPNEGNGVGYLRCGEEILSSNMRDNQGRRNAGRSDIATTLAYLLSDNFTVGTVYGFWHGGTDFQPIASINYIVIGRYYYFFNPVTGMRGDRNSAISLILPEAKTGSIEEYLELIKNTPSVANRVSSLYAVPNGQGVTFRDTRGWTEIIYPESTPLYENLELHEQRFAHIKAENIHLYRLPTLLGGLTLTPEEADELVGECMFVIRDNINTAGDLLLFMLAAQIVLQSGCQCVGANGYVWHYNFCTRTVLETRLGNCGSMANLANFMLQGKYDEIGFILHSYSPGMGGGHVYNYFLYEGRYYIVDFSIFLFSDYSVENEFNVIYMDKLEDYGTRWVESFGSGLVIIVSHTSAGMHMPNAWEGDGYYLPRDAEFTILLENRRGGYRIRTLERPDVVPDWRIPQTCGCDACNPVEETDEEENEETIK